MGRESTEEREAQNAVVRAVLSGQFSYDQLAVMLAGEVRLMTRASLEQMLAKVDAKITDFTV